MKKSNVIIYALLGVASVFLLWLWYFLGLNAVDEPLDLIISIVWWVMIAAAIFTIVKIEQSRKQAIRTIYVSESETEVFNSEMGKVTINEPENFIGAIADIISDLKYDFNKSDFPEREEFNPRYLIHTKKLKDDEWEGEVVNTWTKEQMAFKNRDELLTAIAAQTL